MIVTIEMVNRFLTWPLPESVCADLVATRQGDPHRTGTNLLSATEARLMLEHVLASRAEPVLCEYSRCVNHVLTRPRCDHCPLARAEPGAQQSYESVHPKALDEPEPGTPEGFISIDALVAKHELDPVKKAALDAARIPILRERIAKLERELSTAPARGLAEGLEEGARIARAHIGSAAKERKAKGFKMSEQVRAEERGEDIAAEIIERSIRAKINPNAKEGGA